MTTPLDQSLSQADMAAQDAARPLTEGNDPYALFQTWFAEAEASEPSDANAMALATVDADGLPDVRVVLLKEIEGEAFVFYTNTRSSKGRQLEGQAKAALNFHWKSLARQVRIRGVVEPVQPAQADAYFATRPRGSQIGAWASQQSQPLGERQRLLDAIARVEADYGDADIPRPPHWSGYGVFPTAIEFWQDRPFRLHDRLIFTRDSRNGPWRQERLFP